MVKYTTLNVSFLHLTAIIHYKNKQCTVYINVALWCGRVFTVAVEKQSITHPECVIRSLR